MSVCNETSNDVCSAPFIYAWEIMHNMHFPSVLVRHMLWWGALTRPALAFAPPPSSAFQCLLANRMFDQDTSVQCLCHCFFFSFWAGWGREAPRLYCFICKLCKQKAFSALWQCRPNRSPSSFRALCFSLRDIPFAALIEPKWHYSDKCAAAASIAHH